MINVTAWILKWTSSNFKMVMFLALHPMESLSLNSFVLLEHLATLLTLTLESQKRLKQGYQYHTLTFILTFSKFYRRYYDLISKFQIGLKSLLRQVLLESEFYGDLVYRLNKIVDSNNFQRRSLK